MHFKNVCFLQMIFLIFTIFQKKNSYDNIFKYILFFICDGPIG